MSIHRLPTSPGTPGTPADRAASAHAGPDLVSSQRPRSAKVVPIRPASPTPSPLFPSSPSDPAPTVSRALRPVLSLVRREPLRPALLLTTLVIAADALGIAFGGWHLVARDFAVLAAALAALALPLLAPRYRHDPRIAPALRCAALLLVFQAAAACLSYLLIALAPPLTDATLARWDAALGIDWRVLRQSQAALPALAQIVLSAAYDSGLPQILAVVLYLGFSGRGDRLHDFMNRYAAVTLLVILLSAPIPAAGAFKHFGLGPAADLWHFEALRDGGLRTLSLQAMQGLISMPSLHAAMAVLLAQALFATPLRWPALALNALMLAATPVLGGHYVVDVIAGMAVAAAAIAWRPSRPSRPSRHLGPFRSPRPTAPR